jgi:hypothetical protein
VWKGMFVMQVPLLAKVLRTVLVYSLILVLVRLGGKRGLAAMNTLDFIVVFLLAAWSRMRSSVTTTPSRGEPSRRSS